MRLDVVFSAVSCSYVAAMNAQPYKTAVYPGAILRSDFAAAKLAELQLLAQRLALIGIRAAEKKKLREELAPWFSTEADLTRMVNKQMPTDERLMDAYDFQEMSKEYRQPPYSLFLGTEYVVVHRSPFFAFGPKSNLLLISPDLSNKGEYKTTLPGYMVPAEWLKDWRKPIYHAPSIGLTEPIVAWKPEMAAHA